MTDPVRGADTGEAVLTRPSFRDELLDALPAWTFVRDGIGGTTYEWTTPTGGWMIVQNVFGGGPKLSGPGGEWRFHKADADLVIGALRALGAIPAR